MPLYKKSLLILLVLLGAVLLGASYGYYTEQNAIALDTATTEHVEPLRKVTVYVSGEVKKPGLVTLDEDKRVADAVNAAGGVIETADVDHINMAAHLEDGMQIRVPVRLHDAEEKGAATSSGRQADGKINLNTATEKELPAAVPPCLRVSWSTERATVHFRPSTISRRCAGLARLNLRN